MNIEIKLLSSLEKVFSGEAPAPAPVPASTLASTVREFTSASCLKGEKFNFQAACYVDMGESANALNAKVRVDSDLKDAISLYAVTEVPARLAHGCGQDDYFLKQAPGLYPDLLVRTADSFKMVNHQWRSLWIEAEIPENAEAGRHEIKIVFSCGETEVAKTFELDVIDAVIPPQELMCTQWFHCDCLSTYYHVKPLSEAHWEIIENYFVNYKKYGMNMVLTPMFTPALDTEIGAERPTVQLVDVEESENGYRFGYHKLDRYMELAEKYGIVYFEMAHLFTQWGAKFTPKVVTTAGKRIFGWDVSATDPKYVKFINCFLTDLKKHLRANGRLDHCWFHISDEPSDEHLESYTAARDVVKDVLADCHMMDALSEYKFYDMGLVQTPIPANDAIDAFIENGVSPLWTYYCCSQGRNNVSNRYMAMPSARNRILGLQMYKYNVKGFLHWGYNFWYTQNSRQAVDPYFVTDAGEAFPAGDPFLVYPGEDGCPVASIRQLVFNEALQDQRVLSLLDTYMGHEEAVAWLESLSGQPVTFSSYPHGSEYLLFIRKEINQKVKELVKHKP